MRRLVRRRHRSRVDRGDRLGGCDVGHERLTIPERSAPRIGSTLRSPAATPIDTGTRPSARASNASTRSRSVGQTNSPSMSNGAMRISPIARAVLELARDLGSDRRRAPRPAADPEQRDVEPIPEVEDGADAGMALERPLRGRVVKQAGRHQPVRLGAEGIGDPPERLALRPGRPVPAGQRHDGRADRGRGIVERVSHGTDRRAIADPDDVPVTDRGAQDLRRRADRRCGA